jgi:hypothetical protein
VRRTGELAFPLVKVLRDDRFEMHGNFPVLEDRFNEYPVKNNLATENDSKVMFFYHLGTNIQSLLNPVL